MNGLRESILLTALKRENTIFAGGDHADNKFSLGSNDLGDNPSLRCRISTALVALITDKFHEGDSRPDLILPVPDGANGYGNDIADWFGIGWVRLGKDPQTKKISYRGNTQEAVEAAERIIVVEDVPNKFTTIRKVLALPGVRERVIGGVGIWDRGDPASREELGVPFYSLIEEYIPPKLAADSPMWLMNAPVASLANN